MIIEQLAKLANRLDDSNLSHLAGDVDRVMERMTKVSQYVGTQGYWVRNERCWSNCYRQKRSSNPRKSSQEIWFECQEEYQDSISKANGKWDKYAEGEQLIKTARDVKLSRKFSKELKSRTEKTGNIGDSVFSIIAEQVGGPQEEMMAHAGTILKIAERTKYINPELSQEAFTVADEMIKIAQGFQSPWYQRLWNWTKGGWGRGAKDGRILQEVQQRIQRALQEAQKMKAAVTTAPQGMGPQIINDFNSFMANVKAEISGLYGLARRSHDPTAMQTYQKVYPAMQAMSGAGQNPYTAGPALDQFISALQQGASAAQQAAQSNSPAGTNSPAGVTSPGQQGPSGPQGQSGPQSGPQGQNGPQGYSGQSGGYGPTWSGGMPGGMPGQNFQGNGQNFSGQGANQQGVNNVSNNINFGEIFSQMYQMFKDQGMPDAQAKAKATQQATQQSAQQPQPQATQAPQPQPQPQATSPVSGVVEEPAAAASEVVDSTVAPKAPQVGAPNVEELKNLGTVHKEPTQQLGVDNDQNGIADNLETQPAGMLPGQELVEPSGQKVLPNNVVQRVQPPEMTNAPVGEFVNYTPNQAPNTQSLFNLNDSNIGSNPEIALGPKPERSTVAPTNETVGLAPEFGQDANGQGTLFKDVPPQAAPVAPESVAPVGSPIGSPQKNLFNAQGLPTQDALNRPKKKKPRVPTAPGTAPEYPQEVQAPAFASDFSKEFVKTAQNTTQSRSGDYVRTVTLFKLV